MLKIMTLNLWRYYDWGNRKKNIIKLINGNSPDVIGMQEVQTNTSFSFYPQSNDIANNTDYKYRTFAPTSVKFNQIDKKGKKTMRATHGLAILSKYPIISSESYVLEQQKSDKEARSVLFCTIQKNDQIIEVCNVHFSNDDDLAHLHLKELMEICTERKINPIIFGDFNLFDISKYKSNILSNYLSSIDFKNYQSYPKDNGTLDYVLVPDKYSIKKVICPTLYVSDHRALITDIKL